MIWESWGQGVIIPFHILCFLLIRAVPANAAVLLVEVSATEPQASLNTALFLTATVPGRTRYYNRTGLNSIAPDRNHAVRSEDIFKERHDTLFSGGLGAEQKARVHRERTELHSKHVTRM